MRVLVAIALVGALAGPDSGSDAEFLKLTERPGVKRALTGYGGSVAAYAHFLGACEENYDRASVNAALGEVLMVRRGQGATWDRLNDMLTSIWAQSYAEGRGKALEYSWGAERCTLTIDQSRKDIVRDRAKLNAALKASN